MSQNTDCFVYARHLCQTQRLARRAALSRGKLALVQSVSSPSAVRRPDSSFPPSLAAPFPQGLARARQPPETEAQLEAVRRSVERSQPFGSEHWQVLTAKSLNLEYTFRKPGRPKKHSETLK
jgi:hypothetical protein